jgi:hypothetical protein
MTIQHILYKSIRPNPKWKYRFDTEDPILTKSLKLKGVLSPLVLLQDKNDFVILDGFKRFQILKDNSAFKVPAILYPAPDAKEGFLHGLLLNETRYPLSTIEKSNVVKIIQSFSDDEDFQNRIYNFLDIPYKRQFTQRYLAINAFPESAKHYFHESQFSLRQIERIAPVSIPSILPWIELARGLLMKAQEFVQLIEAIWDISIKENTAVDQLYHKFNIHEFLKPKSTAQQKSAILKALLHQRRYPMLNSIQEKMIKRSKDIHKKSRLPIQISWDKTLEQSGYWLNIYLEHQNSIDQLQHFFESPELRNDLKKLFGIIMHSPEDFNETS